MNKTATKLVLQKRHALQTRRQHRDDSQESEGEDESLPRLIELKSDSSGISTGDYFSARSSVSTNDSADIPHESPLKDLSPRQGGRRRRRRKTRKRVCRRRYTTRRKR